MSDKELDNYIKTINPDFNSHIEKGTIEMNNEYYNLLEEKNELKKQLEEKEKLIEQCDLSVSNMMDCYCERTNCSGRIKDSKVYDSLVQKVETQQKEFILYLRHLSNWYSADGVKQGMVNEILQKYKSIIGGKDE